MEELLMSIETHKDTITLLGGLVIGILGAIGGVFAQIKGRS